MTVAESITRLVKQVGFAGVLSCLAQEALCRADEAEDAGDKEKERLYDGFAEQLLKLSRQAPKP